MTFEIPAGKRSDLCSSCGAVVWWVVTKGGSRMPVSVDRAIDARCREPDADPNGGDGAGVSHFANCPNADAHRKSRTGVKRSGTRGGAR